jgi:hypothetical protein
MVGRGCNVLAMVVGSMQHFRSHAQENIMKTTTISGLIVTVLFAASAAACVGSTSPEGSEGTNEASTSSGEKEPVGADQEASSCPNCHVYCSGNGKSVVGYTGAHSDCTAEGHAFCATYMVPFNHIECVE